MTHVIENPPVEKTKELLSLILAGVFQHNRVRFLCEAGTGRAVAQRNRVMLSRTRKALIRKGKPYKRFGLDSEIFPWTDKTGKRWDCVVISYTKSLSHEMDEMLEDIISKEQVL